jgi:dolichol-phosphate mannosyltransferase
VKITLIIPAYNESEGVAQTAAALRPVLERMRSTNQVEVVFVNDGSRDETESLLRQEFSDDPEIRIVPHEVNRGLGAALRTGFQHASGDVIVTTDFDGTYDFSSIPQLLAPLASEGADIVTASPYHPQGRVEGVPRYRLLFSFGASLLYRILVNWHIHTWTSLFRAYRRQAVASIDFRRNGFSAVGEIFLKALLRGYRVVEVPMPITQRQFGKSKLRIADAVLAHAQLITLATLALGARQARNAWTTRSSL